MMGNSKLTGVAIAAFAATLFVSGCASSVDSSGGMKAANATTADVKCYGGNSCKGQSECKTANSACKAQNACKGQGFVMTGEKSCLEKFGRA